MEELEIETYTKYKKLFWLLATFFAAIYLSFNLYKNYTAKQNKAISSYYFNMQRDIKDKDYKYVTKSINNFLNKFKKHTTYHDFAELKLANFALKEEDYEQVTNSLRKVISKADKDIASIAKLRLARFFVQQKEYDKARKILSSLDGSYLSAKLEIEGDIAIIENDFDAAIKAYKQAKSLPNAGDLLNLKISNLSKSRFENSK